MYNHRLDKVSIGADLSTRKPKWDGGKGEKYAHIQSSIDSGGNTLKMSPSWDDARIMMRFRKNESFRRIKLETLVRLQDGPVPGEPEVLLLDVRTQDEYETCHIQGALSYPASCLSRSMNPFTAEILRACNAEPERIIVIYDLKERQAVHAGNLFFEKGVDNVFVLSKGLNGVAQRMPHLIVGDAPMPVPDSAASSVASSVASTPLRRGAPGTAASRGVPLGGYGVPRIKLLSSSLKRGEGRAAAAKSWH